MKNLFRYDIVYAPHYDLAEYLRKRHKEYYVYQGQYDNAFEDFFRGRVILEYSRDKDKSSPLWRLTFPAWIIVWAILVLFVCPANWIASGHYALGDKSRIFMWVKPWYRKLFP